VAQELYAVMTDPNLGGCVPALEGGGLLLDPTVEDARKAIKSAFQQASKDEATLILAFIGHGEFAGVDFYLLPRDASVPPDSDTAIHLVHLIKELHRRHSDVDGLVVLLDSCYSGVAASGAAAQWVGALGGTLRFEVLTAAADRPAADGCFTRNLVELIRTGLVSVPLEYLRCEHVRELLKGRCPKQVPQLPAYNADEGLYLARNVARLAEKKRWGGAAAETVERLTAWFQPTPQLAEVVAAATDERCVMLTGVAGAGKSSLAAALARSEVTEGIVPAGFVQAVAFVTSAASSTELAAQLSEQLKNTVPAFAMAQQQVRQQIPLEEWKQLDTWQREILGPLRLLPSDRPIRIAIDGLDQLSTGANVAVYHALDVLATDSALAAVRLLVTARSDTPLPAPAKTILLDKTDNSTIRRYLERRKIPANSHQAVVSRAEGSWLIARLLADQVTAHPDSNPQDLPPDLVGIYDQALRRAGASESQRWRAELRPVLGVLAAAGVGPILPMSLLCAASSRLDGPGRATRVRDILVDLRGLVIRGSPGTDKEHVGLFHQTFAEYLLDPASAFGIDAVEPHGALAEALGELAPMEKHDPSDVLHRYAAAREAEHLWEIGRHTEAIKSLSCRESVVLTENLARWRNWHDRMAKQFGKDHPDTLDSRYNVALWMGNAGNAQGALRLLQELLPDLERVLGKDHPDIFAARRSIAFYVGQTGDAREALRQLRKLLLDEERVLGKEEASTLSTRYDVAFWTDQAGDAREALRLFRELLPDMERVLGKDHPNMLITRNNAAFLTGQTGNAPEALWLFQELLPDMERVLGKDHLGTLNTRAQIVYWQNQLLSD
jgi:tetratricopeptide (TPR) repeat protein